jgi:hypothetical protein
MLMTKAKILFICFVNMHIRIIIIMFYFSGQNYSKFAYYVWKKPEFFRAIYPEFP